MSSQVEILQSKLDESYRQNKILYDTIVSLQVRNEALIFDAGSSSNQIKTLLEKNDSLLKEKESFQTGKNKSFVERFPAGQKTFEKVFKKDDQPFTPPKEKRTVKIVRERWGSEPLDEVDVTNNFELAETAFLVFLKENTENKKLPDKMLMSFKKGSNIFRTEEFVPFYTCDALLAENSKRTLKGRDLLKKNDFNFAEMFNVRSKERNKDNKVGYEYELTLRGKPYEAQIIRKDF